MPQGIDINITQILFLKVFSGTVPDKSRELADLRSKLYRFMKVIQSIKIPLNPQPLADRRIKSQTNILGLELVDFHPES